MIYARCGGAAALARMRHRAQLYHQSGCRELLRTPLHSIDHCVSNHGTVTRVVTCENDRCTIGRTTILPKLLDVRYVDDVHGGVLLESGQRNDLRAACPASAPRSLQHSRAGLSLHIDPLANIVVSARGYEPGIRARRLVVLSRLRDAEAESVWKRKAIQRFPSATHAKQIGAAVDRLPVVVRREPLCSKIADGEVVDRDVTDASGRDVA